MKNTISTLALLFMSAAAFAQDSTATATTTTTTSTTMTTEETWYMQPWAWVVGGILLLIILISLFRGRSTGNTTDSVTYTKTVRRDED